jgi:hypothetical protein
MTNGQFSMLNSQLARAAFHLLPSILYALSSILFGCGSAALCPSVTDGSPIGRSWKSIPGIAFDRVHLDTAAIMEG